jgi:hypothetical protein
MLYSRPARLASAGQFGHITGANVALIRARVHGDAVGPGLQAQSGGAGQTGNAQVARVAHGGNFVEVDRQGGGVEWS